MDNAFVYIMSGLMVVMIIGVIGAILFDLTWAKGDKVFGPPFPPPPKLKKQTFENAYREKFEFTQEEKEFIERYKRPDIDSVGQGGNDTEKPAFKTVECRSCGQSNLVKMEEGVKSCGSCGGQLVINDLVTMVKAKLASRIPITDETLEALGLVSPSEQAESLEVTARRIGKEYGSSEDDIKRAVAAITKRTQWDVDIDDIKPGKL